MDIKLLYKMAEFANAKSNVTSAEYTQGYYQGIRDAMFLVVDLVRGEDTEGSTNSNDIISRLLGGWSREQLGE